MKKRRNKQARPVGDEVVLHGLGRSDFPDVQALLEKKPAMSGERWLSLAVIGDAYDLLRRGPHRTKQGLVAYLETRRWVESPRADYPHAFVSLCDVFGFDVDAMRKALLAIEPINDPASIPMRPSEMSVSPRPTVNKRHGVSAA